MVALPANGATLAPDNQMTIAAAMPVAALNPVDPALNKVNTDIDIMMASAITVPTQDKATPAKAMNAEVTTSWASIVQINLIPASASNVNKAETTNNFNCAPARGAPIQGTIQQS